MIVGDKHIKSVLIGAEGTSIKTIAFNATDNELGAYLLKKNNNKILEGENLQSDNVLLVGLYDPEENGLNIEMWTNSDGEELKSILNKINITNLSNML